MKLNILQHDKDSLLFSDNHPFFTILNFAVSGNFIAFPEDHAGGEHEGSPGELSHGEF